jgi:hypothetical protein
VTIWAKDSESESQMYDNVQIEIGCDAKDIWLAFNKSTSAIQFTHAEALEFMNEFSKALGEARMLKNKERDERVVEALSGQSRITNEEGWGG